MDSKHSHSGQINMKEYPESKINLEVDLEESK